MRDYTRSGSASQSKNSKHDFNIISNVYDSLGRSGSLNLKKISATDLAIIRTALSQADKLRMAAWDPGAAYMSGVMDVLAAMNAATTKKIKKIHSINTTKEKF